MEEVNNVSKKPRKNIASIAFLIAVIVSTFAMHFYNNSLETDIEKVKIEISTIEESIKDVQKDKKLQIYSLLQLNDKVIRWFKLMNKVPMYINHMNDIEVKYDLKFTSFSLSNLELITNIEIISDDKWIAYQKTRDFLKTYRTDPNALFKLDFVNQIQWMDQMKFKVSFQIKG